MVIAAACCELQHLSAAVEADDLAFGADLVDELGTVEPRAAANVENPLSGGRAQSGTHETAPPDRISGPIERFELLAGLLIERDLTHRDTFSGSSAVNEKTRSTERAYPKRLMGLEPTTFCMAIVCDFRVNAC